MFRMPGLSEDRVRVLAIVHALKAIGIRVKNWKNFINGDGASEEALSQEEQVFAFGRDLQLLPQRPLAELGGAVPLFLVEACEYLSQHLHIEGLFRKTGSVGRIRALKAEVEQGGCIFGPPRVASLQACDVASLLKQFLRELPSPLIPAELQGPLCQAQTFEPQLGVRDRATLLLTALLPPARARTLRYFCSFLSRVAQRCAENRMEVGNLAVVMAPNLLQCPAQPSRLTVHTERELDQQANVIKALIVHADCIGVVPSFVLETLGGVEINESSSPADGASFSKKTGLSVYRSLRRQRRRSVSEIFVDALSKLKPGRAHTGPAMYLDAVSGQPLNKSPTPSFKSSTPSFKSSNPQSPSAVKRKASEEIGGILEVDGSAKKRRSLHDLREDGQTVCSLSPEGSLQAKKDSKEALHPSMSKKMSQMRGHKRSHRPPVPDGSLRRRKRSLRFFSMSSSSTNSPVPPVSACSDCEESSIAGTKLQDKNKCPSDSAMGSSLSVPVILIDEPGTVVIGSEVEDDPDLLNCSFAEKPDDVLRPESSELLQDLQDTEELCDDQWVLLEDVNSEVVVDHDVLQTDGQHEPREGAPKPGDPEQINKMDTQNTSRSSSSSHPRRSISMPEVSLEHCAGGALQLQREAGTKEAAIANAAWSASVSTAVSVGLGVQASAAGEEHTGGAEQEGEDPVRRRGALDEGKKDKLADPELGLKRRQQRLSVAERLKGFGALAVLLRTPRPPPQLGPARGTVRLRRQGARRFSRSFSQDEVPELLAEPSSFRPEEEKQAFVELSGTHTDPFEEASDEGFLDAAAFSVDRLETPVLHTPPDQSPSSEDQTLLGSVTLEEEQHLEAGGPELLTDPECPRVPSEPAHAPVLRDHESESGLDLHEMLEQQCHIADHENGSDVLSQSPWDSQLYTQYDVFTSSDQQREPSSSPVFPRSFTALQAELQSPLHSSCADQCPESDSSPPHETSPCTDMACLSYDGLISINSSMSERFSLSLDLSPAAFQFRSKGSRRSYRDSPRWPSHEARLATWKPAPF
ncbi:uncharacterized protein LOC143524895 [Brachyhypopomus gauderio]|uniref:uncharacterized protein LOC143524895 n=1 Tax=Brachyhypopomus gauderio TaxID=698409 RepID=UPI004042A4A5